VYDDLLLTLRQTGHETRRAGEPWRVAIVSGGWVLHVAGIINETTSSTRSVRTRRSR
jgi:hypothetical protein